MASTIETPPDCYGYIVTCSGCKKNIQTHTAADLSDPATAAMVKSIAERLKMFCRECYEERNGKIKPEQVILKF